MDTVEQVNVGEAKAQLSRLLEAVEQGREVVIARAGTPVARLVPVGPVPKRRLGFVKDVSIPDGFFFDPLPDDELDRWE